MTAEAGGFTMPEIDQQAHVRVTVFGELGDVAMGTLGKGITDEREQEIAQTIPLHMVDVPEAEPAVCMDPRTALKLLNGEAAKPRKKMAGGDLHTFYIAQRLTNAHYYQTIVAEHPTATVQEKVRHYQDDVMFRALHVRTAAHTSEHAEGDASGCAAADLEEKVIENIVEKGQSETDPIIATTARFMRVPFDQDFHTHVTLPEAAAHLAELKRDGWKGRDLLDVVATPKPFDRVEEEIGQADIEVLGGTHDEDEMLFINYSEQGFDRDNFPGRVFVIDEAEIWRDAHTHSATSDEALRLYQNAMLFNMAAALTLGGSKLRTGIIEPAEQPVAA
jgi:hypothetical protein